MSVEKTPKLTRRNFLKATAGAAGVAFAGGAASATALAFDAGQPEYAEEKVFNCVCCPGCNGHCAWNVHVREGKVVKCTRAHYEDGRYDRGCLRGLTHVQRLYSDNRLKYPLRRVEGTQRGAGEWERISWDEAISEICEKFKAIQSEYGDGAVAIWGPSGQGGGWNGSRGIVQRFRNVLNLTDLAEDLDLALSAGQSRMINSTGAKFSINEPLDAMNSKAVVMWGCNVTDAWSQTWHFFYEAQQNGTKLVVVDPNFTQVASKADLWIPVRPGSDPAMYMGIMYITLEENGQDEDFMREHTCAPFLVNPETGKFVRASEKGLSVSEEKSDYLVWDNATNSLTSLEAATDPALEGSYEVDGLSCRTAFDLLKEDIMEYPPERVSEITQVPVDQIYELAHICMDTPVYHRCGYGPQAFNNGVHVGHAGTTMCAIQGNMGKPGATFGTPRAGVYANNGEIARPDGLKSTSASIPELCVREVMRSGKWKGKDYPIKACIAVGGNHLCTKVNTNEIRDDFFAKLDFLVTIDITMCDMARYADVVLPASQWFEREDIQTFGEFLQCQINEQAVEPMYETLPDAEIYKLIGKEMGFEKYFDITFEEYVEGMFDNDFSREYGITLDAVREKKAITYNAKPYVAWADQKYGTPSERIEFYVEDVKPRTDVGEELAPDIIERERLPRFIPPQEAWSDLPIAEQYPFVLVSWRSRYFVHTVFWDSAWLRELDPEPTVYINPADAERYGIADESYIEAFNDRGHAVCKALYSEGIRPGTLCYPRQWSNFKFKAGSWSELTGSFFDPIGVNQNFYDVACAIRPWDGE